MPRKLQRSSSLSKLGKWLVKKEITVTQFAIDANLAYRTVWLSVHGYKVDYSTAIKIIALLKRMRANPQKLGITVKSLCSGQSRLEFVSTME
jgi:predicted transcriptional regulator